MIIIYCVVVFYLGLPVSGERLSSDDDTFDMKATRKDWVDHGDMFNYDPSIRGSKIKKELDNVNQLKHTSCPTCECDETQRLLNKCYQDLKYEKKETEEINCDKLGNIALRKIVTLLYNNFKNIHINDSELLLLPADHESFLHNMEKFVNAIDDHSSDCIYLYDLEKPFEEVFQRIRIKSISSEPLNIWKISPESFKIIYVALILLTIASVLSIFGQTKFFFSGLLVFICCYIWEWHRLYQTEIAKRQHTLDKTRHCENVSTGVSWTRYILSYFTSTISFKKPECSDYYKATFVDPFFEITPGLVIVETIDKFVSRPMQLVAKSFGICITEFNSELPALWIIPFSLLAFLLIGFTIYTIGNVYIARGSSSNRKATRVTYYREPEIIECVEGPSSFRKKFDSNRLRKTQSLESIYF